MTALGNDYYHFDPQRHCLVGEHSGKQLRLGDEVLVKVVRVDLDEAKIDLELVEQLSRTERRKPKRSDKAGRKKKSRRKDKQRSDNRQQKSKKKTTKKLAKKKTAKKKQHKASKSRQARRRR